MARRRPCPAMLRVRSGPPWMGRGSWSAWPATARPLS